MKKSTITAICLSIVHHSPLLTNIGRSLVFRDQERSEMILGKSKLVDSIILRPGDLRDDVRVSY